MYILDLNMRESKAYGSLMLLKKQMTTGGRSLQTAGVWCLMMCVSEREGAPSAEGHHQMAHECPAANACR